MYKSTGIYNNKINFYITAAQIAIDDVNKNQNILNQYKLTLLVNDGQCAADEVMKSFIGYVTNSTYKDIIGILGPACSDTVEPIAGVAKHYNTIIISYSAEGALINDQDKYPYFFRTIPENSQFRHVYLQLFKQLNWNRVAALTEDGQKYPEYISLVHNLLQENGLNFIINSKFPRDRVSHNMTQYLLDLKGKKAKIIIGDFYDYAARSVMCEAYKQVIENYISLFKERC
ncbi:gamma-aminobutyric acid type B receptor subunit 1-like [Centruroides sculpturatus]|uniref:gamma-aminobutyric acid type B receptor subunit 1-like n=1 Tax=Centruroides sculpturatus TaxID=218467 RepID=UPI000C6E9B75|nr:gamma-aminobutyric acid type B receptor subunit 1-like [Centruroides sculpturatus]